MSRLLATEDDYVFYVCGRCKGKILYVKKKPKVCPECGWGWHERSVKDIPSTIRLNLANLNLTGAGSRGKTEQTTITSR